MSDSLGDLLAKRDSNQPPEIAIIKDFVNKKFESDVGVVISPKVITIVADSSSLAGALRFELHNLASLLKTKKRLIIRIG